MTATVYAWPPVGAVGAEWTEEAPVKVSRSLTTGAERLSAAQRKRRLASLRVSALSAGVMGAGYMEALKRLLGGVHLVRLRSLPVNRHTLGRLVEPPVPLTWTADEDPLAWTSGGGSLAWFTGSITYGTPGTDSLGFPSVTVTGLPPSTLVARPGEFVTLYETAEDAEGATAQVLAPAYSDAGGAATIRLLDALPAGGERRIELGTSQSAVFRPVAYPRAQQPVRGNWTYDWELREVFADEVGGFAEVDPWR